MRNAPDMPQLQKDLAARLMHRRRDLFPARHLVGRVDAGRANVTDALRAHLGRLRHNQAGARPLRVVGGGEGMGTLPATARLRVIAAITTRLASSSSPSR